jgi:hypothetical protein
VARHGPERPQRHGQHRHRNGITDFSVWTLGYVFGPLPVELTAFTAERQGADAVLRWRTAQERDNAYFAVESSPDGVAFREIGRRPGHGSTSAPQQYDFRDANLSRYGTAVVYYRLRQVDTNGDAQLSPVRAVQVAATAPGAHGYGLAQPLCPPSHRQRDFAVAGPATLTLHDAAGRTLLTKRPSYSRNQLGGAKRDSTSAGPLPAARAAGPRASVAAGGTRVAQLGRS